MLHTRAASSGLYGHNRKSGPTMNHLSRPDWSYLRQRTDELQREQNALTSAPRPAETTSQPGAHRRDLRQHLANLAGHLTSTKTAESATIPPGAPAMLIVDDEVEIRRLFTRVVTGLGCRTVAAGTVDEARVLLQTGPALSGLLLDLLIPGGSGLEFLREVRADPRFAALPVTILTGDISVDASQEATLKALGATLRFKPVTVKDIRELTRSMLPQGTAGNAEHQPGGLSAYTEGRTVDTPAAPLALSRSAQ
jgi:CheY-like chemotaxis protein